MASNSDIKQHISIAERAKWNKNIEDHLAHLGSAGVDNHALGNGVQPGFSTNDFTNDLKTKLEAVEEGALNNPHPPTHPYTMITGLANIAHTGSWNDLSDIPERVMDVVNGVADAATVSGGIRVTISKEPPTNPQNDKELWIDTGSELNPQGQVIITVKIFANNSWQKSGSAFM